ncbi:hypothetical protein, partial [Bartonella sp. AC53GZZY]|uniref:hypothetical protein n=1 Tax=Bartonella sp. AC53GZZY TaxID=3243456 RepID=UPI0035D0D484
TVAEGGIGVISLTGGVVHLDGTALSIAGGEESEEGVFAFKEAGIRGIGLLSFGGIVSFKNGQLSGSDAVALFVGNSDSSEMGEELKVEMREESEEAKQNA